MKNLTPHEISVYEDAGDAAPVVVLPPSGVVARLGDRVVASSAVVVDGVSVPVSDIEISLADADVEDGPVVVSLLTALAVSGRGDVYVPGPEVRDRGGRIIGCVGLRRVVGVGLVVGGVARLGACVVSLIGVLFSPRMRGWP